MFSCKTEQKNEEEMEKTRKVVRYANFFFFRKKEKFNSKNSKSHSSYNYSYYRLIKYMVIWLYIVLWRVSCFSLSLLFDFNSLAISLFRFFVIQISCFFFFRSKLYYSYSIFKRKLKQTYFYSYS